MDIQTLFNLNGRVALVTGGSRGIGKMIVEGYLKAGAARVYISARKVDQIEETVAEFGNQVIGLPCDLSTVDGCLSLAAQIAEREEKVDILVNNAGAAWGADFGQFPEAGWDRVMDLNVKSLFFLTQALHPQLKAAATFDRPGKVINIASIDGLRINPWQTYSYQASKAAVIHLTRRLAAELVKDNILVSGIAPGAFSSEMMDGMLERMGDMSTHFPRKRIGMPAQLDSTLLYLCGPASECVTGTVITVDDGQGSR